MTPGRTAAGRLRAIHAGSHREVRDRERSFALAVDDMTDHSAEKVSGGVTVTVSADTPAGGATLNTLGQLVRAYDMEFYTGTLTNGETHILRFGDGK